MFSGSNTGGNGKVVLAREASTTSSARTTLLDVQYISHKPTRIGLVGAIKPVILIIIYGRVSEKVLGMRVDTLSFQAVL